MTATSRLKVLVVYHLVVLIQVSTAPKYTVRPEAISNKLLIRSLLPGGNGNRPGFEAYRKNISHGNMMSRAIAMTAAVNLTQRIVGFEIERCIVKAQVLKKWGSMNWQNARHIPIPIEEKISNGPNWLSGGFLKISLSETL